MISIEQMRYYLQLATVMETDCKSSEMLINKIDCRAQKILNTPYYTEEDYEYDLAQNPLKVKAELPILFKIYFALAALCSITAIFQGLKLFLLVISVYFVFYLLIKIVVKIMAKKQENNAKILCSQFKKQYNESVQLKEKNDLIIENYKVQINEAYNANQRALHNLQMLYSEGVLPKKYQNYVAVSTMYQWLKDGRCTEIYGHGGLFDTYEYELCIGQIVSNLQSINNKLDLVIDNQYVLYDEIKRGNEIAENTYQSVKRIESNSEALVNNSEQIKRNTDIIAMNSQYQSHLMEYNYYRSLYY